MNNSYLNRGFHIAGATFGTGICAVKLTALGRPQLLVSCAATLVPLYACFCHPQVIVTVFLSLSGNCDSVSQNLFFLGPLFCFEES
jgi:hypothetical protein